MGKASPSLKAYLWGLAALVLVFSCAVIAFADVESYKELKSAPSEIVTNASGAESLVGTTAISNRLRASNSNTTVAVRVDFSGSAGDTVIVYCMLYQGSTFLGCYQSTVTAGAATVAGGDNVGTNLALFDLSGSDGYEIRHAAPSAGSVDLTWWAFGASSQQ